MKVQTFLSTTVLFLISQTLCLGQTITWVGNGDGLTWTNPPNWSGNVVPSGINDVVITSGAGTGVRIASGNISIRSIQCTKALTISNASFTVNAGASQLDGPFTIVGNGSLTVNGSGTTLTANGLTIAADGNLNSLNGGGLYLPNLFSSTNVDYTTSWKADGAGSLVDVSALTNLVVGYNSRLYLEVYNGGKVDVRQLLTKTNALIVDAQDAASVVDLSGLTGKYTCQGNYEAQFKAQDGATVLIPNITQLENATLHLRNTGAVSTAQLTLLTNVSVRADNATPDFNRVTNINDTSVYAYNGGIARLTNVFQNTVSSYTISWRADGAGSLVDVSALTNLAVGYNSRLYLEAYNGGTVDLQRLTSKTNALIVDAQGTDSRVDLSGLAGRYTSLGNYTMQLRAQDGAALVMPNLTQFDQATLIFRNAVMVPTAQINLLTNVDLTVDGTAPDFGQVTNINDTSIYAFNGGVARLTNVMRAVMNEYTVTWQANGAGSLVDVSALTNLAVGYNSRLYLEAYNGGTVDLHRLVTKTNALIVDAQGTDSLVNLSALTGKYSCLGNYTMELKSMDGASVLVPNLTQLENVTLYLRNTGGVNTAQLTLLTNVTVTADKAIPDFGQVTNINDTAIYAINGGVARLTNVTRTVMNEYTVIWQADGVGSRVDVSTITNLAVNSNSRLYLQAYRGGQLDFSRLITKTNALIVDAHNAGSVVNLSGLSGRYTSKGNYNLNLTAQDQGTIWIPNLTQLEQASLTLRNTGAVSTAQLNLLTNVILTVDKATSDFGQITNVDDCSVYANNGGVVRLTNVSRAVMNAYTTTWQANGTGSLIDFSSLANLSVGNNSRLYVQARTGGKVDLRRLVSLSTGSVQALADGTGSVVDLSGVCSFISSGNYASSLTAQNSGNILFTDQAFLLANVGISIPAGNPFLPSTLIASPSLTLYGRPWHSYWVEQRDTRSDTNAWLFLARVPMTNSFQAFAPTPPANTEYRLWDFIADPPIMDMFAAGNQQTYTILYGATNKNYALLTVPTLASGSTWTTNTIINMTNAFRIQPSVAAPDFIRFFKAREL
jgi:CHASE3 domain sensor protein